ncbi:MAG: GNAT family N-acetyltransferase [Pseudomonadota bacterium]
MTDVPPPQLRPDISVVHITRPDDVELEGLVNATLETIADGRESSWRGKPSAQTLRAYWNGVALSPQRQLIVGRLGKRPVGGVQIVQAGPLSEIGPEVATLDHFFLCPSARGHGLARRIIRYAEDIARAHGIISLDLVIREDRTGAARMFEGLGYRQWARKETFRRTGDQFEAGLYFSKIIDDTAVKTVERTRVA